MYDGKYLSAVTMDGAVAIPIIIVVSDKTERKTTFQVV